MGKDNPVMYICRSIRGSHSVIHVGAVGTNPRKRLIRHKRYKEVAPHIIGFDYDVSLVRDAKKAGFGEIFVADATDRKQIKNIVDEHGTFRHVIATEVIEHIGNLSLFLDNMYLLLADNGSLYLTTPDVASEGTQAFFRGETYPDGRPKMKINPDHICWFCKTTLRTLLERSNLKMTKATTLRNTLYVRVKKDG
jgi:2-polyprenyl-3-methyl-5-hydroxy-6-metoxy-1,4-benzoquinol methylase